MNTPDQSPAEAYRDMPTVMLKLLLEAFTTDLEQGADCEFCRSRLTIIRAILKERGTPQ